MLHLCCSGVVAVVFINQNGDLPQAVVVVEPALYR